MVNSFNALLSLLNAKLIVFFENDFIFVDNYDRILSDLVKINSQDINLLLDEIKTQGYQDFAEKLHGFLSTFKQTVTNDTLFDADYPEGEIGFFLYNMRENDRNYDFSRDSYNHCIEYLKRVRQSNRSFYSIFYRYGIATDFPLQYEQLENALKEHPGRSIRVYKDFVVRDEEHIISNIKSSIDISKEFCICIIDNHFEDGYKANAIVETLHTNTKYKNLISVVFSSKSKDDWKEYPPDYYVSFVSKTGETLKNISEGLAFCAYGVLFNKLKLINQEALDFAFKLSLRNKENMQYLACMAHTEGISEFEAIYKWFDLSIKRELSKRLINENTDYNFIIRLTKYLNDYCLAIDEIEDDYEFKRYMYPFNTFEIFDYTVNKKYSPPAPGDIFESNGKYFILVGQDCDFTIRGNSTSRKSKNAELIQAKYRPGWQSEKVEFKNKNRISFNYFQRESKEVGILDIELNSLEVCDFNIIDLCVFNEKGECSISLDNPLDGNIKYLISRTWENYYKNIQEKYKAIINANEILNVNGININIFTLAGASKLNYSVNQNILEFSLKRVCRINTEFKEMLIKNYWEYRGRMGFNTIAIANIEPVTIRYLLTGFPGQKNPIKYSTNIEAMAKRFNVREKNKDLLELPWSLNLGDILGEIKLQVKNADCAGREVILEDDIYFDAVDNLIIEKHYNNHSSSTEYGIKVTMPYIITNGSKRTYYFEDRIDVVELTGIRKKECKNDDFCVTALKSGKKIQILNSDNSLRKLDIMGEISEGLFIPKLNLAIRLDKKSGIINIEDDSALGETAVSQEY